MANKKKDTIKKVKKQPVKTVDETNLKDVFVADAQNTTFTDDDIKKLEESRQQSDSFNIIETTKEIKDENSAENVLDETPFSIHDEVEDVVAVDNEEQGINSNTEIQTEVTKDEKEEITKEETLTAKSVDETTVKEVKKQPKTRINRMTTKEAYGYHWMGLIYDE